MKVKRDFPARDRVNFFIPFRSVIGPVDQHNLLIQHPRSQRRVEKRVRLLLRDQPMQLVGQGSLYFLIVLLTDADDQVVRTRVVVPQ